ncbi:MAG: mechanosensitive ion channel family protein [Mariprofundaceae bacterium]|nr:mechanosensitive ion channel family protein [Mariprofundaceae bacterium]
MTAIWTDMQNWMLLDIPASRWVVSLLILFITIVGRQWLLWLFDRVARNIAARTATDLDNVLLEAAEKPAGWLLYTIGVLATLHTLNPPEAIFPLMSLVDQIGRILSLAIGTWFLWRLIDGLSAHLSAKAAQTDSSLDDQLVPFISKTLKIFIVITAVLVIAQNMGYSISGLVASLGIGGIAVAMAARDTLANVFGSIMILMDRPFAIGDWIKAGDFEGVVEEIGFRSTRIRTFEQTLINIPNSVLANMVIDNIDARSKRRIMMRIGLTYSTTPEQMQKAIEGIEAILAAHPGVDQQFKLVKFDEFADSSLSIFLYYFSASKNWTEYLQVRQEVNVQIMQLLESMNLDFAFPTRTLHISQNP